MRQLFTWRFFAALGALAGLALLLNVVLVDDNEIEVVAEPEMPERRIDLIESVLYTEASPDFRLGRDGLTRGTIDFVFDQERVMRVVAGTPGSLECDQIEQINSCVVFADLLGDAVIWFAVLPKAPRETVELPPIVDLDDGYALFENGWQIPYPPVIERICEGEDVVSFSDFLRRFGPESTSVVDIATKQVTQVRCAGNDAPDPVVTTIVVAPPLDFPNDPPESD